MIRNQIEAIVNTLTAPPGYNAPTFLYGTAKELNQQLDLAQFPVVMLYNMKPSVKSFTLSNAIDSQYSIIMAFLFKTEFDVYTSDNEMIIDMADAMCNEFMVKLANYRETPFSGRYFKIRENDKAKSQPFYNKNDVNSTGVTLQLDLRTMYNTNIPLP